MSMKIIHISQSTGGVKTYVTHILNYANKNNYNFAIIAPENAIFEEYAAKNGMPYYRLDLHRGNNPIKNLVSLFRIVAVIKKEKPDLLHVYSAKGGFLGRLAAKITNTRVIYTPHAFSYLPFTGLSRVIYYFLELLTKSSTDLLLAISYSEANRAIYELGYEKRKVKVIANSLPVNDLPTYGKTGEKLNIRMIGRLTYQKNHMLFLEIANLLLQKYPDLQFSILGAGIHDHCTNDINHYIDENRLRDNIQIESWGNDITSKHFLKETDIFVMTSVFEGLAFSLLEAMSFGVPCVVSKVDGNTDVINNYENGFSCLTVDEFYNKIELLINNAELRIQIGLAGYEYVKARHSLAQSILKIEEVYDSMASYEKNASLPAIAISN